MADEKTKPDQHAEASAIPDLTSSTSSAADAAQQPAPPESDREPAASAEMSGSPPEAGASGGGAAADGGAPAPPAAEQQTPPAAEQQTPPAAEQQAPPGEKPAAALPPRGAGPLAARKTASEKKGRAARAPLPKVAGQPGKPARSPGQGPRQEPEEAAEQRPQEEGTPGEPVGKPGKPPRQPGKISVPNKRTPLSDELQQELESALAEADVDALLGGGAGMGTRAEPLTEGQQVEAKVLKVDSENVFVALGGPDEGMIPREHFVQDEGDQVAAEGAEGEAAEAEAAEEQADRVPSVGESISVIVRGYSPEEGLYVCALPGRAIEVADWSDLEEGTVVEAMVTGSNSGGLECKVGSVRGFIPLSQISEYRVEEPAEFVGQRLTCLVSEANPRRKNLVLSRRAVLERERAERRKEQLEQIQEGDVLEGTVRSVKDFGAFVDLGGLEGLIHVSRLSWERIKHPSEVIQPDQKVKVKVEKVDKQTGKIGLSYRDLLEHPWDKIDEEFPVGSTVRGTVTRTMNFGAFVRVAPGVEGLVHISELAHHRVLRVENVVKEGDEVEVKVLGVDRENQKMSLSLKATQVKPQTEAEKAAGEPEEEAPREPAVKRRHAGPLKGGTERSAGGEQFGLRW